MSGDPEWLPDWSHLSQRVIDGLIELNINPNNYTNPDSYNWINAQRSLENGAAFVRIDLNTKVDLYLANHVVAIFSCSLSIIGSLFIIMSFFIFRQRLMTGFHRRLILYLSVSDLSISFLHGLDHAVNLAYGYVVPGCWYLGTLLVANQLWLIVFSYYLYKLVVKLDKTHVREQLLPLICWGIPALIHFLPLLGFPGGPLGGTRDEQWGLSYGPREAWCYIRNANYVWLNLFLAVPAVVSFGIVAVLYAFVLSRMQAVSKEARNFMGDASKLEKMQKDRSNQKRLIGYPMIFLVQWLALVVEFILVWAGASSKTLVVADIFTVGTINISGFLNGLWFAYNEKLLKRYRLWLRNEDPWEGEAATAKSGASSASVKSGASSGASGRGGDSSEEDDNDTNDGSAQHKRGEGKSRRHRHSRQHTRGSRRSRRRSRGAHSRRKK